MFSSLTNNISSDYLKAFSAMLPKKSPQRVRVYVESEDDIAFWKSVLHPYEQPNGVQFEIGLSSTTLAKGENAVLDRTGDLLELLSEGIGEFLLLAVDSDYDYLLEGHYLNKEKAATATEINTNPYILQTYTYATENLRCYAGSLQAVVTTSVLNDERLLDFTYFFTVYSRSVYSLLLWNLMFFARGEEELFPMSELLEIVQLPNDIRITDRCIVETLQDLDERVQAKGKALQEQYKTHKEGLEAFADKMQEKGLEPQSAYLFLQGHTLLEKVVLMLLRPMTKELTNQKIANIKAASQSGKEVQDNLNYYRNKCTKIEEALALNTAFENCYLFDKIEMDIAAIFPKY